MLHLCIVLQEHNPGISWDLLVFKYKFICLWSSASPLALAEATNIQCRLLTFKYVCNYTGTRSQSSSVSTVTRLWVGWPRVWFPVGEGIFSSCPEHSCQVCISPSDYHCLVRHRYFGCGAEVTTVPHLVPRLRVSGAKSLLPPCVFKACTRTTSTFIGICRLCVDLICYSFIANGRIINVILTATSRMSVKSWMLSTQSVFRNAKEHKTAKPLPSWNMRLLELCIDVAILMFHSAQL